MGLVSRFVVTMVESSVDHVTRVEHLIIFFYPRAFVVGLVIVFVFYDLE